jgi:glycosyl transferase family 25
MTSKLYHCLVITLEDAHERRATISSRLESLGIPYTFVPGVDGRKIDVASHPRYTGWKRRTFFGRDLSGGELGCILAHRAVYEHIANTELAWSLVLEDDAILSDELTDVLDALLDVADEWDIIRFLGREKNYRASRRIKPLGNSGNMLARTRGTPGGAYGYLVNLHAARRLLAMTERNWLPIDTLHGFSWVTGLETLSVVPSPVLPNDDIPSCIDEQDAHKRWSKSVTLSGLRRIAYPLTRGLFKTWLNIMVRWVWLRTLIPDRKEYRKWTRQS